jgi:formate-dependent nitrite reductase membrane component NrfD
VSVASERERPVVPRAEPRSYYGQPVIKEPVWTWEIPFYLFTGGMAGASAGLAWLAERDGNEELARRSWAVALAAAFASPALLISDLGRPGRFLNMLRVLKVTSPMSVGSWLLSASGTATGLAATGGLAGRFPAAAGVAKPAAALLGLPLATYTSALVANTAVPVWHEARFTLPFVFAGGSAASAGSAAVALTPPRTARAARRLTVIGVALETAATKLMEQRLGELGEPYRQGAAGRLSRAALALGVTGAVLVSGWARRSRAAGVLGGALVAGGAVCQRWSVFKAGFLSAADPKHVVEPQRKRIRDRLARGGSKFATPAGA